MRNLFDIKNRVIVMTGGTGVLGSCMVEYLAEQGAKVAILARNAEKGEALAKSVKDKGFEASFYQTDVNDKESVEKTAEAIMKAYGRVDVLVNGAGGNQPGATIGPDKTIFDLDVDAFKKVVDLNLFGTVIPFFGGVFSNLPQSWCGYPTA